MKILIALLAVCLGSAAFWASFDKPLAAPDWSGKLGGISYNPSGIFDQKTFAQPVPESVIRADMKQLSTLTSRIRTYSVSRGLDRVPYIAKEFGLKVTLGIWLSDDRLLNESELARAIEVVRDNPDVIDRVIVGNETLLRGELTASDVVAYMHRVSNAIANPNVEVGTAEVWSVWLKYPTLAQGSAFVGIHLLPYWEGIASSQSMGYITDRVAMIQKAFPDKKIVIAEAGWPSEGRVKTRLRSVGVDGSVFRSQVPAPREGERLRLLHHRSVRPAVESGAGRCGGCVLGTVGRRSGSEIRVHRQVVVVPAMADVCSLGSRRSSGTWRVGAGSHAGGHVCRVSAAGRNHRRGRVRHVVHHRCTVVALRRLEHGRRHDVDHARGVVHGAGVDHRKRRVGTQLVADAPQVVATGRFRRDAARVDPRADL